MEKKCPIEFTLSQGPLRYGVIGKRISKISAKVLIQHLREMEEDGLITRRCIFRLTETQKVVKFTASNLLNY